MGRGRRLRLRLPRERQKAIGVVHVVGVGPGMGRIAEKAEGCEAHGCSRPPPPPSPGGKKLARKPPSMAPKMMRIAASLGAGIQSSVKWRSKRGVTPWRPPPGGPQAATKVTSSTVFQNNFLRS